MSSGGTEVIREGENDGRVLLQRLFSLFRETIEADSLREGA